MQVVLHRTQTITDYRLERILRNPNSAPQENTGNEKKTQGRMEPRALIPTCNDPKNSQPVIDWGEL